jgi:hypothetical protein
MSFNSHLQKISVVHSDRPNHAYLNPFGWVCISLCVVACVRVCVCKNGLDYWSIQIHIHNTVVQLFQYTYS